MRSSKHFQSCNFRFFFINFLSFQIQIFFYHQLQYAKSSFFTILKIMNIAQKRAKYKFRCIFFRLIHYDLRPKKMKQKKKRMWNGWTKRKIYLRINSNIIYSHCDVPETKLCNFFFYFSVSLWVGHWSMIDISSTSEVIANISCTVNDVPWNVKWKIEEKCVNDLCGGSFRFEQMPGNGISILICIKSWRKNDCSE